MSEPTTDDIAVYEQLTGSVPHPQNADKYIAMRGRGERLPSRADLVQRIDDCEQALRDTERALASTGAAPLESECDCDCHLCDCYLSHSAGTDR